MVSDDGFDDEETDWDDPIDGADDPLGDLDGSDAGRSGWRETLEGWLPSDEQATLDRVHRVGDLLDEAFRVPGTDYRVGLDPVLGILPVAGDSVATVISLYIVVEAARAGVSRSTLALMTGLVAVDAVIGSIPVLGTIFDAVWKANKWNVSLLERELSAK